MQTNQRLIYYGFDTIPLNDNQVVLVEDDKVKVFSEGG